MEAPDPHCKSLFENGRVHAIRVELGPQDSTRQETHRNDYLLVSVGDSSLQLAGNNTIPLQLHDGEMQLVPGRWPHKIVNSSTNAATVLMIELKDGAKPNSAICGLNKSACRDGRFGRDFYSTYSQSTLFETDSIRLVRTELGPGSNIGDHAHPYDHVVIALTPLHLKLGTNEITEPQSAVAWQAGGFDAVWNVDSFDQRFLLLELK